MRLSLTSGARHDAVLVGCGCYKSRPLPAPGVGLRNVVEALDYLTQSNRQGLDQPSEPPQIDASGKHVVVIGGGDTAMDCVRTAIRQGAGLGKMPVSPRPLEHAGLAARGGPC